MLLWFERKWTTKEWQYKKVWSWNRCGFFGDNMSWGAGEGIEISFLKFNSVTVGCLSVACKM